MSPPEGIKDEVDVEKKKKGCLKTTMWFCCWMTPKTGDAGWQRNEAIISGVGLIGDAPRTERRPSSPPSHPR